MSPPSQVRILVTAALGADMAGAPFWTFQFKVSKYQKEMIQTLRLLITKYLQT
jgi:hypothetical protein